ncbi:MAG: Clp1/GlmU family protein [Candidatus Methanomethylicia archaeon]
MSGLRFREFDLKVNDVLWVSGPAKINIVNGLVEVFGAKVKFGESIVVKRYKSIYLKALEDCKVKISYGAHVKIVGYDGIPMDWHRLLSEIIKFKGKIMVLGGVDTGKNTLVTFLSNKLFDLGFSVGILDADVGQNEIGPPATMALGIVRDALSSLDQVELFDCVFIGSTSPSYVSFRVFKGLERLINASNKLKLDYLIINTTGWVSNGGVKFKVEKIGLIKPDIIIGIQREDELEPILNCVDNVYNVFRVSPSQMVRVRDRFDRKMIRQMNYLKWFNNATNNRVPLNIFNSIEPNIFDGSPLDDSKLNSLSKILGVNVAFSIIKDGELIIFPYEDLEMDGELESKIVRNFDVSKSFIIPFSSLVPLLVAFEYFDGGFAGLGIITNIDFKNRYIQIYTNVDILRGDLKLIFGLIRLDPTNFDEIGFSRIPI